MKFETIEYRYEIGIVCLWNDFNFIITIFYFNLGLALAIAGTLFIAAVAFFFSAVAEYIAGVGSSNSPVSGMTIATLMFTAALVFVVGSLVGANNETMMFTLMMLP